MHRLLLLGVAVAASACGPNASPRPAEPARPVPAPSPTPARSTMELLAEQGTVHWLVRDRAGRAVCRPFRHEIGNGPDPDIQIGWFRPAVRIFEGTGGQRFAMRSDGHSEEVPADAPVAPWQRVEFSYRLEEGVVTLHSPHGSLTISSVLLARCEHAQAAEQLPFFASDEECLASRSTSPPIDLGSCAEVAPAFPYGDAEPTLFNARLTGGGALHQLIRTADGPRCVSWTVDPGEEEIWHDEPNPSEGTTTRVAFGFFGAGHTVTLLGPHSTTRDERGREVSSFSLGCGQGVYVRSVHPDFATVAGERWYYEAEACQAALDEARPTVALCR